MVIALTMIAPTIPNLMTEGEARALVAGFSMPPGYTLRFETMAEQAERYRKHLEHYPDDERAKKRHDYLNRLVPNGGYMLGVIKATVDTRDPEQEFEACGTGILFELPTRHELVDRIVCLTFEVELHNMAEWFKSEGETMVDPHTPAQYVRLQRLVGMVSVPR